MLVFKNVTKSFGDINALNDVSFTVKDGEFVFLTGPSGAGKTTIMRLIMREFLPDSGEIFFEEQDLTKLEHKDIPQLRRNLGVIFQDFKVLHERTVAENVEVALAVLGLTKSEWNERVKHVLNLIGLRERADLFPSQLSGGELQRVAMARALVVNPKIILADEPTGNLDWETADKIMDLFEKINYEGKTILMATHHKGIVGKMKKRVIEIKDGRIISQGVSFSPKEKLSDDQDLDKTENKKSSKKEKK